MTLTMGDILHVLFDAVSSLVRLCGGMSLINAWVDSPISGTLHSIKLHFTAVVYLKKSTLTVDLGYDYELCKAWDMNIV